MYTPFNSTYSVTTLLCRASQEPHHSHSVASSQDYKDLGGETCCSSMRAGLGARNVGHVVRTQEVACEHCALPDLEIQRSAAKKE